MNSPGNNRNRTREISGRLFSRLFHTNRFFSGAGAVVIGTVKCGRDGSEKPCDIPFPTAVSRPFPPLVSVPIINQPAVRCPVPVPIVYRPAACSLPLFPSHCLSNCSHPTPAIAHVCYRSASFYGDTYFQSLYNQLLFSHHVTITHATQTVLFYATLHATLD